jgi:hypothetical protein
MNQRGQWRESVWGRTSTLTKGMLALVTGAFVLVGAPGMGYTQQEDEAEDRREQQMQQQRERKNDGQEERQRTRAEAGDLAIQGTLRGVVRNVDLNRGVVNLATGRGAVSFRAKPNQIANLRPGDQLTANYVSFGQTMWLVDGLDEAANGKQFGRSGQVTGNVVAVDKVNGRIAITSGEAQARSFLAHPQEVQNVLPGEYLTVEFQRIGESDWVQNLREGGAQGQQGESQ